MIRGKGIIVLFVIVMSGSLIPFLFGVSMSGWLFASSVFLLLYAYRHNEQVSSSAFAYYLLLSLLLLISCVVNLDVDSLGTYLGIIVRLTIGLLVCSIISPRLFLSFYSNFFYYYAIISLIFYSVGALSPDYILTLPITYNDAGTGYRHLFIYFYQGIESWNYRNAGLFWEGGAYSAFLCLALLSSAHINFSTRRIFIILLAILTTGSTTGIAASILIMLASKRLEVKHKFYSIALLLAALPFILDIIENIFIAKFVDDNISYLDRSIGIVADLIIFIANPMFGSGLSKYNEVFQSIANSLGAFAPTSSNSFTGILAVFGILYAILIFTPIMFLFYKLGDGRLRSFINIVAVVLIYSSQGLVYFPLSYIFLFYGIYFIKGNSESKCMRNAVTKTMFVPCSAK